MEKQLLALDAQMVRESMRQRDKNGFLQVKFSRLTQEQVAPYYGKEIPHWEEMKLDPDRIYYGWRNPDELKAALPTFNGVPLLIEHKFDSAQNPNTDLRVGTVGTSAKWEPPYITNALSVWDEKAIDAIEDGTLRDLSCGYRYTPDFTAGKTPDGVDYDFVMRDIACNHVALVNDGRAPDCYVEDSTPKGLSNMEEKDKTPGALDGFAEFARKVIENAKTGLSPEAIDALVKQFEEAHAAIEQEKASAQQESAASDEGKEEAPAPEKEPDAAQDEECAKDEEGGAEDEDEKNDGAMDAALVARQVRKQLAAQYEAAEAVRGVIGSVNALAYDSAEAIYVDALKQMGVKDAPAHAAKYVFDALQSAKATEKAPGAMDSAPKDSAEDFLKKYVR